MGSIPNRSQSSAVSISFCAISQHLHFRHDNRQSVDKQQSTGDPPGHIRLSACLPHQTGLRPFLLASVRRDLSLANLPTASTSFHPLQALETAPSVAPIHLLPARLHPSGLREFGRQTETLDNGEKSSVQFEKEKLPLSDGQKCAEHIERTDAAAQQEEYRSWLQGRWDSKNRNAAAWSGAAQCPCSCMILTHLTSCPALTPGC